jgi:hypothetical protein
MTEITARLEELRAAIRAENISYGEIAELQGYGEDGHIPEGDVELREWAGLPEHPEDDGPDEFRLMIELGNAAMQTPDQVADALRRVAAKLSDRGDFDGDESGTFRDYNGNTVGKWSVK